jgi:predicted transcriptional regulator
MSRTRRGRALRESLAPYGDERSGRSTKLSISLPEDLADVLRETARESGSTVSALIAASLRRSIADAEQDAIDRALNAQAQENVDWAEAFMPETARLVAEAEW